MILFPKVVPRHVIESRQKYLPKIYNIQIIGDHPNPNRFNGSTVPLTVTLGPDSFLVDLTVSTTIIETKKTIFRVT